MDDRAAGKAVAIVASLIVTAVLGGFVWFMAEVFIHASNHRREFLAGCNSVSGNVVETGRGRYLCFRDGLMVDQDEWGG